MTLPRRRALRLFASSALVLAAVAPIVSRAQQPVPAGAAATQPTTAATTIRIKAGSESPFTDPAGRVWQAATGFVDGETIDRPTLKITGTDAPGLFLSERYDFTAFAQPLPNGRYTVKLYFAETYEDVTAAGQRVFDFNVEGQDVKGFDPFKEAGGRDKAVVKTFDVEVKDAKLDIKFTAREQATQINAVEIVPTP